MRRAFSGWSYDRDSQGSCANRMGPLRHGFFAHANWSSLFSETWAAIALEQAFGGDAADGCVEQLDHVKCRHGLEPAAAEAVHQLQQASGVGGKHGLRLGSKQVIHL